MSIDIVELTLAQAQAAMARGDVTAEALAQSHLERIARYNPVYNAILFQNPHALQEARAVDRRRAAGTVLGPLAGMPVVVKDTMDMAGVPTTGGWAMLCARAGGTDLQPARDATVVARLRAAGAVILGKTNVPVLSHSGSHANDSWAGPTLSAIDTAFVPGGSSAGTATAVAASMAMAGLGEETGGSIQNPAAAQALVGLKPTLGLVSCAGVMPLCGERDVVGPIARCVHDAATVLDAVAGPCAEDPRTRAAARRRPAGGYARQLRADALIGARLGLYGPGWRDQPLAAETARLYERAQRELAGQGAQLVDDPFAGSGLARLRAPTPPFADADERGLESLPYDLQKYLERMAPGSAIRDFAGFARLTAREDPFAAGGVLAYLSNLPGFDACRARPDRRPPQTEFAAVKRAYRGIVEAVFARERLDALAFPQMRGALPLLHSGVPIAETTVSEINIAGLPAVTVPAGYDAGGAPFALVLVGRPWSEAALLSLAYAYECATRHRRVPVLNSAPLAPGANGDRR